MFEAFRARYTPSSLGDDRAAFIAAATSTVPGYREFMTEYAGATFDRGLYRVHSASTGGSGQRCAEEAFPEFVGRIIVVSFDWLGRQFALDLGRIERDEPQVLLLEPGTGQALEIPVSFSMLHDEELVEYADAALASDFFAEWSEHAPGSLPLSTAQCAGYRVPLFLGGEDGIENLEVSDFDVYWTLMGQLRLAT